MSEFKGKVVLVTGGTAGIGKVTAVEFAKQGAKVIVTGRREKEGADAVSAINAAGGEGLYIQCDVSKTKDVQRLMQTIEDKFGRLDIAFNNAGVSKPYQPVHEQTEEDFDQCVAINLKGVWLCMRYEIPLMLKQGGGGYIVNNSSVGGLVGLAGLSIYNATKHGVIGLTRSAALDYAKQGIRINAVCPGIIQTEMTIQAMGGVDGLNAAAAVRQPIGRAGKGEEIASAVMWLCTPGAGLMVGAALALDGGRTITA
jgi:NAD(P)-dependent dehydrogenase (short-subunit alcohol dehydrogenase family)